MIEFYSEGKKPKLSRKLFQKALQPLINERSIFFVSFTGVASYAPLYQYTSPLQSICIQYTAIHFDRLTGVYQSKQFFSVPGYDERRKLIQNFLQDTENNGTLLFFNNKQYEMLKQFQNWFPEFYHQIQNRLNRTCILSKLFEDESAFYKTKSKRFTIKQILGVIAPSYLTEYNDARITLMTEANAKYLSMNRMDIADRIESQIILQGFCYRNALALVKIFESLKLLYKQAPPESP